MKKTRRKKGDKGIYKGEPITFNFQISPGFVNCYDSNHEPHNLLEKHITWEDQQPRESVG